MNFEEEEEMLDYRGLYRPSVKILAEDVHNQLREKLREGRDELAILRGE